jgi:quercetin dioxygenase-like cupin family protein
MIIPAATPGSVSVVRSGNFRVTQTPNATMTTLASPQVGGSSDLCLWVVEFGAGASGPDHTMNSEQVWVLERGSVRCHVGDQEHRLEPGDVIRLAGGLSRRFHAESDARFFVCGLPGALATTPSSDEGVVPPWIA